MTHNKHDIQMQATDKVLRMGMANVLTMYHREALLMPWKLQGRGDKGWQRMATMPV